MRCSSSNSGEASFRSSDQSFEGGRTVSQAQAGANAVLVVELFEGNCGGIGLSSVTATGVGHGWSQAAGSALGGTLTAGPSCRTTPAGKRQAARSAAVSPGYGEAPRFVGRCRVCWARRWKEPRWCPDRLQLCRRLLQDVAVVGWPVRRRRRRAHRTDQPRDRPTSRPSRPSPGAQRQSGRTRQVMAISRR